MFFDDVRMPVANLVGQEGCGWGYARYLLGQERTSMGNVGLSKRRLERVRTRATATGLIEEPAFRRRLTLAEIEKALEITQMRVVAGERRPSAGVDPTVSALKIRGSEILQAAAALLLETLGPETLTAGFPPAAEEDRVETGAPKTESTRQATKPPIYGLPWRKVDRQHPPFAARANKIPDGVQYLPQVRPPRAAGRTRLGHERLEDGSGRRVTFRTRYAGRTIS